MRLPPGKEVTWWADCARHFGVVECAVRTVRAYDHPSGSTEWDECPGIKVREDYDGGTRFWFLPEEAANDAEGWRP